MVSEFGRINNDCWSGRKDSKKMAWYQQLQEQKPKCIVLLERVRVALKILTIITATELSSTVVMIKAIMIVIILENTKAGVTFTIAQLLLDVGQVKVGKSKTKN